MHPRNRQFKNEEFLEWVRRHKSIITGGYDAWDMDKGEGRNDPSHTWSAGKTGKRNDLLAVPLERSYHTEYHSCGHETFEARYKVDLLLESLKLVREYTKEKHGIDVLEDAFNKACEVLESLGTPDDEAW